jgi:D-hydroxyproline dehydrogenase subunit beta
MRQLTVFDAIVVGAGIVGAACAKELADAGMRVCICEAGAVGGGATATGMGHLAVMDDSEPQFLLTSYSQCLWRHLSAELPPDAEYVPCGSLWIAADEQDLAEVKRKFHFYSQRGIPVEILDWAQVAEAEPNLRRGMPGALLMPADCVCYPPCVARFLVEKVCASGGTLLLGKSVVEVAECGVKVQDETRITAGLTVLATGAWITNLVPETNVKPRKGQLLITDRYPGFVQHQLLELGYLKSVQSTTSDSVAFVIQPRPTGQILIGSSRQYGAEDRHVDTYVLGRMLNRAVSYMPPLENLSTIRTWAGFRAATPDKLPLIGQSLHYERVYLATGHEGLGISMSLATARLLADEILGRPSEIPRAPYEPRRMLRSS